MEGRVTFERLNDFNWASWKFRMELLLLEKEVWNVVATPKGDKPADDWASKDAKARVAIGLSLETNQLCHVHQAATAHDMWLALKGHHQRNSLTNKVYVYRRLFSLRLSEGGDVSNHLNEISCLANNLCEMGENVADHLLVAIMLSSLPASYSNLVTSIETRAEVDLKVEYVRGQLLNEWRRRKEAPGSKQSDSALKTAVYSKNGAKSKLCHYCRMEGHFKRACPKAAADQQEKQKKEKFAKAKKVVLREDKSYCFSASYREMDDSWYLDSGASAHMTSNIDFFESLAAPSSVCVFLADGRNLSVEGAGKCEIVALDTHGKKKKIVLNNVLYVPELASNLLSVGRMADEGFEVFFKKNYCSVLLNGEAVLEGERQDDVYRLMQLRYQSLMSMVPHVDHCLHLWHRRLGHRQPEAVKRIVEEALGDDLKLKSCGVQSVCTVCCEGKLARNPFPKESETKSFAILDLVHTDLCGPLQVATVGGCRYILTMIDDFSKFTIVYLLKFKSETCQKIREYVNYVNNKFGRKPKILRSDGGGEYSSMELISYLKQEGIVLQQTAPYSPQQNGTAERKNRTLMEMVRCLLAESGLTDRYWGEAVMTANYLLNRLPSAAIKRTPYEYWNNVKPKYSHLRVFGCHAFVHIPDEKRQKLDKKAVRMVFVGYAENRKAYRFLDPSTDRIVISRDAKFLEEELKSRESVSGIGPVLGYEETVNLRGEEPSAKQDSEVSSDEAEDIDETLVYNSEDSVYDDAEEVLGEVSSDSILAGFSPELRRSTRSTQGVPPERYRDQAKAVRLEKDEPRNLQEARTSSESKQWQCAMEAEIKSHSDNGTWELVELPAGRKPVGSRWVFKIKRDAAGNVVKHKARLVAQGYTQQFGSDFDEVFAPVISQTTFRTLLAVASKQLIVLHQFDVKTAYLHGELEEEVFMRQPPGFVVSGRENLVCRLRKSIYGLKQSARCWNQTLHEGLLGLQFKQSRFDPCLYTRNAGKHVVFVLIYVVDIVVGCKDEVEIAKSFQSLRKKFDITNLGKLTYFLGREIDRTDVVYSICLRGYIQKVAERFEMQNAKPSKTPMDCGYIQLDDRGQKLPDSTKYRSLVGALLYIAVHARPDIAACTSILGRRVCDPFDADWTAAKRVVRYLLGTIGWKLQYTGAAGELTGYTDADWAGDQQTRRSTTGYCFLLGGAAISWISRRQSSVTLSSMEAEYVSLSEACKEAVWLRNLLDDLNEPQQNATILNEDNQSCIAFVNSERTTRRSKHIATREQYVKELGERNLVRVVYCPSDEQAADILTKPLGSVKQLKFAEMIGMAVPGSEVSH